MKTILSICVVTMDLQKIRDFLAHHAPLMHDGLIEWLIFVEDGDFATIKAEVQALASHAQVLRDHCLRGVSEKRNVLLANASSERVMFLDDDSFIDDIGIFRHWLDTVGMIPEWTLFATRYHRNSHGEVLAPTGFKTGTLGTGTEWNQIFDTAILRKLGGWDERFGPGQKWHAGEACILMFRLHKLGLQQSRVANIVISHPMHLQGAEFCRVLKYRKYREAQGAVLHCLRDQMTLGEFCRWLVRFTLVPLSGSPFSLCKGEIAVAVLRFCTPFDVFLGILRCNHGAKPMEKVTALQSAKQ